MPRRSDEEIRVQVQYRLTEELVAAKQRYRRFADNIPDVVFECDESGRLTYVNLAWEQIVGCPSDLALGRSITEFLGGEGLESVAGMSLAQQVGYGISDDLWRSLLESAGGMSALQHRELVVPGRDGVERWFDLSFWPTVPNGFVGILHDITRRKRAQEELNASENKLRTITTTALDAVIMITPAGKIAYCNPAAEAIFGYSCDELAGQDVHQTITPMLYRQAATDSLGQFASTGTGPIIGKTRQMVAQRKDGTEFPIELSVNAIQQEDGWWAVAVVRDITDRKRAEEALRESEAKYRRIFETIQDVYAEVDARTGKILEISPSAERVGGYCREEMLGRDITEFYVRPEQRQEMLRRIEQSGVVNDFEVQLRAKSGEERTVSFTVTLAQATRGGAPTIVGTLRDVTDRKRAEEEREHSRQTMQAILDSMPVGVAIIGRDKRIRQVNSAALSLMGYGAEDEIAGKVCHDTLCPAEKDKCPILDLGGRVDNSERILITKDQRQIPILKTVIPLHLNGEDLLLETFVDISSRKEFEQRLDQHVATLQAMNKALEESNVRAEAATRAKSEFLANMSHEIRTPITAIMGFADLLCDVEGRSPRDVKWAERIRKNADHLRRLLDDILDLSKIEAGRLQVRRESCNLAQIVDEVAAMFREDANSKNIAFGVQHGAGVPATVGADQTRIRQILVNFVSNALKFTPRGSVGISTKGQRIRGQKGVAEIHIAVTDTGVGIAPDKLGQLFQPFQRLHDQDMLAPGTGLGLAVSHRLAGLMGGRIVVESAVGKGSCFKLILPADRDGLPAQPEAESAAGPAQTEPLRGLHVLLVEDNVDNEEVFCHMLRPAGLHLTVARDGASAIGEVVRRQTAPVGFDVILMDMQMPVMDGFTATSVLRRMGVKIPIIAVTAFAMEHQRQQCLDAGCDACLPKPIVRQDLYATIARMTRRDDPEPSASPPAVAPPPPAAPPPVAASQAHPALPPIDSGFAEILARYVRSLRQHQQSIVAAEEAGDAESIRKIVHRLKGTAANYGFPEITETARVCQDLLTEGATLEGIRQPLGQLKQLLADVLAADAETAAKTPPG